MLVAVGGAFRRRPRRVRSALMSRLGNDDEELADALAADVRLAAGGDDAISFERERLASVRPDLASA